MIRAEHVSVKTPDGRLLLKGLNFTLAAGETMFIRGPNGIGKSTLLRACLGETHLISGNLAVALTQNNIAYLPQLQNTEIHLPYTLKEVLLTELDHDTVDDSPDLAGLLPAGSLSHAWNSASGGERQKTLLLRALMQGKKMLILDEPMNHLDAPARKQVAAALAGYAGDGQRCLIIVSHDQESGTFFPGAKILDLTEYLP